MSDSNLPPTNLRIKMSLALGLLYGLVSWSIGFLLWYVLSEVFEASALVLIVISIVCFVVGGIIGIKQGLRRFYD